MDTSPAALFRKPPVIRFTPQRKLCLCGERLLVQKSRRKNVLRMTGPLIAHETVAYCLALWALNGKNNGDGYGFPFDRPLLAFTDHLLELDREMPRLLKLSVNDERNNIQYLFKLAWSVSDVAEDLEVQRVIQELRWRCRLFDSLRKAMRIALPGGGNGLNDEGTAKEISSIRKDVMKFRCRLDEDSQLASDALCSKMAKQIDKYHEKLFASMEPVNLNSEIESKSTADRVLPGFRKIINTPDLPEHLMRLAVYQQHLERPN